MVLPDFLIVGFPRCGTTFLMQTMVKHKKIHLPQKEIGFFNKEVASLKEYNSLFKEGMINGEKTPNYIRGKKAMNRIFNLLPKVKLIICVRYPVQAIHSLYDQRVRSFYLEMPNGIDPGEISFPDIVNHDLKINAVSLKTYDYHFFIEHNALSLFREDQIKVIVQEELYQSPQQNLDGLFTYLGVEHEEVSIEEKVFYDANYKYDSIDYENDDYKKALAKTLSYYKASINNLYGFLGRRIDEWDKFEEHYVKLLK
jgi:hypothetical protein